MASIPVLCNARSGGSTRAEAKLRAASARSGVPLDPHMIEPSALGREIRRLLSMGAAVIGVAGGDGTVSDAADVLAGTDIILLVFPAGTLNHFARALGIDTFEAAALALADEQVMRVDVGEVNGRVFVNGVSLGLYPRTLRLRRRWESRLGKWPAALLATCVTLAGFSHRPRWRHDPASTDAPGDPLVWVGAGRGSFRSPRLHPRQLRSGVLETVVVATRSRLKLLRLGRLGNAMIMMESSPCPVLRRGRPDPHSPASPRSAPSSSRRPFFTTA